ncbi:MAG TPA: hypothetical protein VFN63_03560, partial [Pseudolabrys sp.]|nr:hypothetical protein [Pseudolabrys sp.]
MQQNSLHKRTGNYFGGTGNFGAGTGILLAKNRNRRRMSFSVHTLKKDTRSTLDSFRDHFDSSAGAF